MHLDQLFSSVSTGSGLGLRVRTWVARASDVKSKFRAHAFNFSLKQNTLDSDSSASTTGSTSHLQHQAAKAALLLEHSPARKIDVNASIAA